MLGRLLVEFGLLAYVVHGLLGGMLLTLLFGISEARAKLKSFDAYPCAEGGAIGSYGVLVDQLECHLVLHFLAPFYQLALEVVILFGHLVYIYMFVHDALLEESVTVGVSSIKVDGSDECFKGIA